MFSKIISFSVHNKLLVALLTLAIIIGGINAMLNIPLDAVPDITNNQVQVVTTSPSLAAQEVEQFITFPVEMSLANVPRVEEIRSISRFGLSVVTVVFDDGVPILDARQYVQEQLNTLSDAVPPSLGEPEMMPITTGLGEIYQYTLNIKPGYEALYDDMELRTIQDWIVKRQLMGIKGIVDVSSFGGRLKQYEVAVHPEYLNQFGITMDDVFSALEANNQNSGGGYIEKEGRSYYIRTLGIVQSEKDIGNILIERRNGIPIHIRQVADVRLGSGVRFGAMTMDGKGEVVGGITLMLKGGNSSEAIDNVHKRIEQVKASLPEGVSLDPFLDRSVLVKKTIATVTRNLVEGGLIVIVVLILLLGNFRAGIIVASVIPLSMLFAFILMDIFGVSANLMSLGAIDFGIVVDGAVIITEALLHAIVLRKVALESRAEFDLFVIKTSSEIYKTAAFGVIIILVVFIPIMTLTGIEGKMFRPMAQTFSFAILGAFILTLTYVPVVSALLLKGVQMGSNNFAEQIMKVFRRWYKPSLTFVLKHPVFTISASGILLVLALVAFLRMGAEFIPNLEEGDMAMQMTLPAGSSLSKSIETSGMAEKILLENFPEVKHVVSKIGTAEVPTDPMGIEDADVMIIMKDKDDWTTTDDRQELIAMMKEKLEVIDWASFEFTQPIQLRFNELITGAKTDIAIKIFGEDMDVLRGIAGSAEALITEVQGAADVKVEQTEGLSQYLIAIDRDKCAQFGVNASEVNRVIRTAYAGEKAGMVYEGERRFDLVVRLEENVRKDLNINKIFIHNDEMKHIPVAELVVLTEVKGPVQIQREDAKRRITIGINVRDRDVESLVEEIKDKLEQTISLPPGYFITYGGAFENLQSAKSRLMIAVPVALLLIMVLLYVAFGSLKDSMLIFTAVPLSAVGGVLFLILRGMPFSISAGVGFIALFGVAVLNGIVMIGYFKNLRTDYPGWSLERVISNGAVVRLRPVLMTALVAMLGFMPMAFSGSEGAEVQKPLATVVIGGLVTSTLLTLVVLPAIYLIAYRPRPVKRIHTVIPMLILLMGSAFINSTYAQEYTRNEAVQDALKQNISILNALLQEEQAKQISKGALNFGATEVGFEYGEINAPVWQDYRFEVVQNIGNPVSVVAQRSYAEALLNRNLILTGLERRSVRSEASIAWYTWSVAQEKLSLLEGLMTQFEGFLKMAETRESVGDIGKLEFNALLNMVMQLDLKYQEQLKSYNQSAMQLSELTLQDVLGVRTGVGIDSMVPVLPSEIAMAPLFNEWAEMESLLSDARIKASGADYFPSVSLGYFNQQIEGVGGLDGFRAGLSLPLWNAPQRSAVQVSKIEASMLENQLQLRLQLLGAEMQSAYVLAMSSAEQFYAHGPQALQGGETMMVGGMRAYELGEINYLQFTQIMSSAIELTMAYWDLKLESLCAMERLKYYTK